MRKREWKYRKQANIIPPEYDQFQRKNTSGSSYQSLKSKRCTSKWGGVHSILINAFFFKGITLMCIPATIYSNYVRVSTSYWLKLFNKLVPISFLTCGQMRWYGVSLSYIASIYKSFIQMIPAAKYIVGWPIIFLAWHWTISRTWYLRLNGPQVD